jgi:hypothetical protein
MGGFSNFFIAILLGLTAEYALAQSAIFTLNLPLLTHSSSAVTTKPAAGAASKVQSTETATNDLEGAYLEASWGRLNIYVYPFAFCVDDKCTLRRFVSGSYMILRSLEVGADFGYNSTTVDTPKKSTSQSIYGVFGTYYYELTRSINLEAGLAIDATSTTTTTGSGTSQTETNASGNITKITVNGVVPLTRNVNYVGGFEYLVKSDESKEAKIKSDDTTLKINIATVRFLIN